MHSLNATLTFSLLPPRYGEYFRFHAVSRSVNVFSNSSLARRHCGDYSISFGGLRKRQRDFQSLFCFGRKDWEKSDGNSALEADLLKFMKDSENPGVFPTRKELVNGGRPDLAEAIVKQGGWLSMGWDMNRKEEDDDDDDSRGRIVEDPPSPSLSKGSIEIQKIGIEGILERLKEQRKLLLDTKLRKNKSIEPFVNGYDGHNTELTGNGIYRGLHRNGIIEIHQNDNSPSEEIQEIENEISPTLRSLRTNREESALPKEHEVSFDDWQKLSDAYEFQENETMNTQYKLRSLFAKLIVLEKKTNQAFLEAQKVISEKQRKVKAAQKAVKLIRPTCIVWPHSAFEVLLTGSFDGWTTQRKMERTSRGDFSIWLKLYPGTYEIKFYVDNEWRIDPQQPKVYNNGYLNNLLMVT